MLLGITLCHIMDQLRPKIGNPSEVCFWFLYILLVLYLPNVPKKYYHGTGEDQLSAQYKGGMVSVAYENVVSAHG